LLDGTVIAFLSCRANVLSQAKEFPMRFLTKTMIWTTFYTFFTIAAILIFKHFYPDDPSQIPMQRNVDSRSITDQELLSFTRINTSLLELKEQVLEEMEQIIQENGLSKDRYNKIASMENNPDSHSDATEEELSKAREISHSLELMQSEMQSQVMTMMEEEELTPERFQEISMELETNTVLQKRILELLEENGM
ncbi:MAG: DUF4168 domain-containing protein, partial [Chitinispirillaceae bacterium]